MGKEVQFLHRPTTVEYAQLPLDDEDQETVKQPKSRQSWKLILGLALTCLAVGATIGASINLIAKALKTQPQMLTCGNTSDEARARGCVMEPMVYGWMPKECYYADLSSEYHPYEDREWFTTNKYEERVTPEELWAGTREHVYTHQYHTEHCFFLMRKLSRAVDRREKYIDHKSLQVEHADHCSMVITGWREAPNSTNDVVLGFYRCMPLPWASGSLLW